MADRIAHTVFYEKSLMRHDFSETGGNRLAQADFTQAATLEERDRCFLAIWLYLMEQEPRTLTVVPR